MPTAALRLRSHVELRQPDRAPHGGSRPERRQCRGVGLDGRARNLLPLSDRLRRQHAVETDLTGKSGVDRGGVERPAQGGKGARLPVAPGRFLQL